ncbi:uncharacterized protein LOC135844735 [Planococcus citri]|uniref:uncharacterized protein LOC135844735 n=1 Tax=Planococcus citri TaxID=170843 RepID=UPI0031F90444
MNPDDSFENFLELREFQTNREGLTTPSPASQGTLLDNCIENWFESESETSSDIAHEPRVRFQTNHEGFPASSFIPDLPETNALPVPRTTGNQRTTETLIADDKLALLWRKLDFLIRMISSLGSVNNVNAIEADIRYNHLICLYQSFVSNVDEIMHLVSSIDFNRLIEVAEETQRRVISIEVSLKTIMLDKSPSSTASKVVDQTDRTVRHSISDSDSVVTKKARTDADVPTELLKSDQSATVTFDTMHDSLCKNIELRLSKNAKKRKTKKMKNKNVETAVAETAQVQLDDLVNKTKSMSVEIISKKSPSKVNDQTDVIEICNNSNVASNSQTSNVDLSIKNSTSAELNGIEQLFMAFIIFLILFVFCIPLMGLLKLV